MLHDYLAPTLLDIEEATDEAVILEKSNWRRMDGFACADGGGKI